MTEIKRLTPEMVEESYRKIGATPQQGTYRDFRYNDNHEHVGEVCCGIGAYVIAEHGMEPFYSGFFSYFTNLGFNTHYHDGFTRGFDGHPPDFDRYFTDNYYTADMSAVEIQQIEDAFTAGYEDGVAGWAHVSQLELGE